MAMYACLAILCLAAKIANSTRLHNAEIIARHNLRSSYDFIIVGGGASGLTVADRLCEDPLSTLSSRILIGLDLSICSYCSCP